MSIPSDPTQPPPNFPKPPPTGPQNQSPASQPTSYVDPTGAWAKFLSTPGHAASADEVKLFMEGMLKMFNVLIQQQNAAAKRASEQMKKAIEGDE
jgi:hypothetical protein